MAQKKNPRASAKAPARGSKPIVAPSTGPKADARPAPKAGRSAPPTRPVPASAASSKLRAPRGKVVQQSPFAADVRKSRGKPLKSDARLPKTADMSSVAPAKKDRSTPKSPAPGKGSSKGVAQSKPSKGSTAAKPPAASKGSDRRTQASAKATGGKSTGAKVPTRQAAAKATTAAKAKDEKRKSARGREASVLEPNEASEGDEGVETKEEELSEAEAKEAEEFDPVLKLKISEIEEPKKARVSIKPKNPNRPTLDELRQMPTEDIWGYYRRAATAKARNEKYIEEMRNVLMELHLPLVKHIAERLLQTLPKSIELGDLESAGAFGLMDSIRGFDPDRGIKFKTYCTTRIRGSILDMLRSQDWVPRLVRLKASRIEKTLQRLQGEYGREPTHAELAAALDLDHTALSVELSQSRAKSMFSLSERWDDRDDDSGGEKIEIVEDQKSVDPVFELNRRDLMLHITKSLSHKERFIIEQYYDVGHTMREIGEMLALTESRVCQIHSNVMARLKDLLNSGSSELEA